MKQKTPRAWKKLFDSEEFERRYDYEGTDLGVTLSEKETIFKVWAPTAETVVLNLFASGTLDVDDRIDELQMRRSRQGVWSLRVGRSLKNLYYTYTVTADGRTQETQDVYTKACGVNGRRSMIADLRDTDPAGWEEDRFTYDAASLPVIYEVHIRDFSYAKSSGIPAGYRGKYRAFTVADSTLYGKGEKPTCLAYLKELGITHVHLLPCFDFASIDEAKESDSAFNWGYDPLNYNVPEGSYATDPCDGLVRIREFKEMVQALHAAGIGVIMDVVYNHTYSMDSCFQRTVPYYYYRQNADGTCSDGSGCGNETASERVMFRRYITESVCYWAKEYHIDGFRFDLMGLHDVETMNGIRRALDELPGGRSILMYGEPWTAGPFAMRAGAVPAVKANVEKLDARIAIFNDDTRDAVKGSVFSATAPGFVNGGEGLEPRICAAVCAWCGVGNGAVEEDSLPGEVRRAEDDVAESDSAVNERCAKNHECALSETASAAMRQVESVIADCGYRPNGPGQTISYVSAHDNWTLWDKLCYTLQETPEFRGRDERVLAGNRFAAGIILTSLGAVFFQAGEEAARTKDGIGDSYQSPPGLNALDWERMYRYEDLTAYYRGMLAIRRSFSGYWQRSRDVVRGIRFYKSSDKCVVFSFDAQSEGDPWRRLWVVYLAGGEDARIRLPASGLVQLSDGMRVSAVRSVAREAEAGEERPDGARMSAVRPVVRGAQAGEECADGMQVSAVRPVMREAEAGEERLDGARVSALSGKAGTGSAEGVRAKADTVPVRCCDRDFWDSDSETVSVKAGAVSVYGECWPSAVPSVQKI